MTKIMFVCHGNICRSPMAEFVMKQLVKEKGKERFFKIASSAVSQEEIGSDIHNGTKRKLREMGVPFESRKAVQLTKGDYSQYDYFIGMDQWNLRQMLRIFEGDPQRKQFLLLSFAGEDREVEDPWYTGNFDKTYEDVKKGCDALLEKILKNS